MDSIDTHRQPRQTRSHASLERMLAAAEKLMADRSDDDFALTDVAKAGKVSIGSIYCRFDSKDALIQAVQRRVSLRIQERQRALVTRVALDTESLAAFVPRLVDEFAESLREYAPILRPMMQRAARDEIVSKFGKSSHAMVVADVTKAMVRYRDSIAHPDPARAVQAGFNMVYAAVARSLSLGSTQESADGGSWRQLKQDLAHMFTSFLVTPPNHSAPAAAQSNRPPGSKKRARTTRH
jgi:AcrR family transcriptional regulator